MSWEWGISSLIGIEMPSIVTDVVFNYESSCIIDVKMKLRIQEGKNYRL